MSDEVAYEIDEKLLRDICPSYSDVLPQQSINDGGRFYLESKEAELLKLRDDYRLKVESGNNYVSKLLDIEKDYFEKKYGPKIYNYLKNKRDAYMMQQKGDTCDDYFLQLRESNAEYGTSSTPTGLDRTFISGLLTDISNGIILYNELSNYNGNEMLEKYKNASTYIKKEMDTLQGKNSTTSRKIEYRKEELENVNYANNLLTLTYYIAVIVYLLVLISSGTFDLNKNYLFYLFLILFPIFIYPVFFLLMQRLYEYLVVNVDYRGPKSAFLNSLNPKTDTKFVDDFDV